MNKKFLLLLLFIGILFAVGVVYIQHREQKKMEENFKEAVRLATSSEGQETVLGTLNSVEVCGKDTVAAPRSRYYKSYTEAVNAYSELDANGNDVHMVIRYGLDNDQDPIAFMEELKKHGSDPEWVDNYCKENNISVGYEIVQNLFGR